jgi:hypothetical protein
MWTHMFDVVVHIGRKAIPMLFDNFYQYFDRNEN